MIKNGFIIEPDFDDSDNYVRYVIKNKKGAILRRGVYEYKLNETLNELSKIYNGQFSNEVNLKLPKELFLYIRELVKRDKRKGTDFNPYVWRYEREKLNKIIEDIYENKIANQ